MTPVFNAKPIKEGAKPARAAGFCPWCEDLHIHGLEHGEGRHRTAHCSDLAASPLKSTGYLMEVDGSAAVAPETLMPRAPMAGRRQLWRTLGRLDFFNPLSRRLWASLAKIITGFSGEIGIIPAASRGGSQAHCSVGPGSWCLRQKGRPDVSGRGLITLASALYGVSAGVAAVRILEGITGEVFDDETKLALAEAIDQRRRAHVDTGAA